MSAFDLEAVAKKPGRMAQNLAGALFAVAVAAGVMWGGQLADHTWGPALLALAGSLAVCLLVPAARERLTAGGWWASATVAAAILWILWRCFGSPVAELARADALLAATLAGGFLWAVILPARSVAWNWVTASLALLALTNAGIAAWQIKFPEFSWPFPVRPEKSPSGLFGHYNHLADFSLVAAAILAARAKAGGVHAFLRVLAGLGAVAGVACVVMSTSRGGILSLCVAVTVLVGSWAIVAWRDKAAHRGAFLATAVLIPVVGALLAIAMVQQVEDRRGMGNQSLSHTADNVVRIALLKMAITAAETDTWVGGGARSFGWKKYRDWNADDHGIWFGPPTNDDLVHNELMQSAVDYGVIGVSLVSLAVVSCGLVGLAGLISREKGDPLRDSIVIGGLAAAAGTLTHSNFSFVTHTFPGALYLGCALGMLLPRVQGSDSQRHAGAWPRRAVLLPLALGLGWSGWHATLAFKDLWRAWHGSEKLALHHPEAAAEHIDAAILRWPNAEVAGNAAAFARAIAERPGQLEELRSQWLEQSDEWYRKAEEWNPLDPEWTANHGHVLAILGRNREAEDAYLRTIQLQGGMESTFRGRYFLGCQLFRHWHEVWMKGNEPGREEVALHEFLRARELFKEARSLTPNDLWIRGDATVQERLEEVIRFLEEARVRPRAPGD